MIMIVIVKLHFALLVSSRLVRWISSVYLQLPTLSPSAFPPPTGISFFGFSFLLLYGRVAVRCMYVCTLLLFLFLSL